MNITVDSGDIDDIDGSIDFVLGELGELTGREWEIVSLNRHVGTPAPKPGELSDRVVFYTIAIMAVGDPWRRLGEGDTIGRALAMAVSRAAERHVKERRPRVAESALRG